MKPDTPPTHGTALVDESIELQLEQIRQILTEQPPPSPPPPAQNPEA